MATVSNRAIRGLAAGALALAGGVAMAASAAAAPTISGADTDVWNAAAPDVSYVITDPNRFIRWDVDGEQGFGFGRVTVTLPDLKDGKYELRARNDAKRNNESKRTFRVDRTPPVVKIGSPSDGSVFDIGAPLIADYSCSGASACVGTVDKGESVDTSSAGAFTFSVTAEDEAGNEVIGNSGYTVVGPPSGPPSGPPPGNTTPTPPQAPPGTTTTTFSVWRPVTINARALKPTARAHIRTRRPILRWNVRRGALLYNVQVFRVRGTATYVKVLSAFPRRNAVRIPAGKRLAWNTRYVWRVWPYLKGGFPARPLGLSYFLTTKPPARTAGR